jgi:hypothetical protein
LDGTDCGESSGRRAFASASGTHIAIGIVSNIISSSIAATLSTGNEYEPYYY